MTNTTTDTTPAPDANVDPVAWIAAHHDPGSLAIITRDDFNLLVRYARRTIATAILDEDTATQWNTLAATPAYVVDADDTRPTVRLRIGNTGD